jgi:hypothetical protein
MSSDIISDIQNIQGISGPSKQILGRLKILNKVLHVCDPVIIDQTKMIVIDWA